MATSRISGEHSNVVLQRLRDDDEPHPLSRSEEFKAFLKSVAEREGSPKSSESVLIDYVMPPMPDGRIFEGSHIVALFEYLRDEVLPLMNGNEELTDLATRIINDEIERHNFVLEKRQSGIAA